LFEQLSEKLFHFFIKGWLECLALLDLPGTEFHVVIDKHDEIEAKGTNYSANSYSK